MTRLGRERFVVSDSEPVEHGVATVYDRHTTTVSNA